MGRLCLIAAVCAVGLAGTAWANPGTTGALNGVEDVYTGAIPPPGFYFMNYTLFYEADALKNAGGHDIPGTKATVIADALRFIYSSEINVLGGNLAWHTVIPVIHKDLQYDAFGVNNTYSGVGDIYVSAFILSWHLLEDKSLHIAVGQDVILPTGEYHKSNLINPGPGFIVNPNIGTNHYTFESVLAVTKMFPDSGLVLDAKLMYDIHTEEPDTKVKTGDQFHVDFAATVPIIERVEGGGGEVRAGVNGYYFTSLEEDEINGTDADTILGASSKERVFAIGPMVRYEFSPKTSLSFKAQFEQNAHNRPEGSAFWLKLVHAF